MSRLGRRRPRPTSSNAELRRDRMSVAPASVSASSHGRLQLPETLRRQLDGFRRRVWAVKSAEAACVAALGVAVAFLLMFGLDRLGETPAWARAALFAVAAL